MPLKPQCVIMKSGESEERSAMQDHDFAQSLRRRLGQPDLLLEDPPAALTQASAVLAPAPARGRASLEPRSPLREISEAPDSPGAGPLRPLHDDDEGQPRQRKLPARTNRSPSSVPHARRRQHKETQSHYFSKRPALSSTAQKHADTLWRERLVSPHRQPPVLVPDSEDDEPEPSPTAVPRQVQSDNSEYEFGFNISEAIKEVERVEQAHATQASPTATAVDRAATQGTQPGAPGSSAPAFAASGPNSLGPRYGRIVGARAVGSGELDDVINIDSDEDEKENIPAFTRRQRRRLDFSSEDVIEVSD